MNETYLVHHGIKGMRWGVRRQRRRAYRKVVREQQAGEVQKKRRSAVATGAVAIGTMLLIYGGKKAIEYTVKRDARMSQERIDQYIKSKQREIDSLIADSLSNSKRP